MTGLLTRTTHFSGMFVVAHAFLGLLLGLALLHITMDRRVVPLCVVGALLPDLIDKPLALLIPALGSGRTIGHSLLFVFAISTIALILYSYWHTLLGVAFACSVFLHQIFDSMWQTIQTWVFPLFGPFPLMTVPDYTGYYLGLEITSPSEWLFLGAFIVIVAGMQGIKPSKPLYFLTTIVLTIMGIFLIAAAGSGQGGSFFAPSYSATTSALTGILAILGAVFFVASGINGFRNT